MLDSLKKFFLGPTTTSAAIAPKPVQINPTVSARAARNIQRIERLRQAIEQGDERPGLKAELERRTRGG